jgi:hypothetical protein
MVAHKPDDLRSKPLGDRLDPLAEASVSIRFA